MGIKELLDILGQKTSKKEVSRVIIENFLQQNLNIVFPENEYLELLRFALAHSHPEIFQTLFNVILNRAIFNIDLPPETGAQNQVVPDNEVMQDESINDVDQIDEMSDNVFSLPSTPRANMVDVETQTEEADEWSIYSKDDLQSPPESPSAVVMQFMGDIATSSHINSV